ncbi:hypothetical protein ACSPON_000133 [Klebsiella aerogenes]|uniref:hypothetical protein n=1 Tax=Klebsiella pneumoniae complex TaxID=3390273 RepID=UPI0011572CA5|nr:MULTISPECIES: hypothetical protein [Klebsiella]EKT9141977.1 hypothetical protein [Klebsiella variicola]EKY1832714.1 hypothetical protein [Klebsiella aerogenes]MBR8603121.1 hypothetical protein [Klebsiella pneumoniae subsp. pneumoniae]MCD9999810.1 hypothetical protein [Klebsiella quasipneumoniae subsp. similipneumoniae]GKO04385.1 hypothetical protein MS5797_51090 [Klebsiella pneumoniae]
MSENNKGDKQQRGNAPSTGKDQKSNSVSTPSEPIRYDSSIPVPGSKVVTESYQPPVSKKQK